MSKRFLLLHGFSGSSPGHWQLWLAPRLRDHADWVSFPELADPNDPDPEVWEAQLAAELSRLADGPGERVVVAHSLGGIVWLRHTARIRAAHRPDRVMLVAPPCGPSGLAEIVDFFPVQSDPSRVRAAAGSTLLVCSDNDPYCPEGAHGFYGERLGIPSEVIPGAEHLNTDAGYGAWPHMEAWCLGQRPGMAW